MPRQFRIPRTPPGPLAVLVHPGTATLLLLVLAGWGLYRGSEIITSQALMVVMFQALGGLRGS